MPCIKLQYSEGIRRPVHPNHSVPSTRQKAAQTATQPGTNVQKRTRQATRLSNIAQSNQRSAHISNRNATHQNPHMRESVYSELEHLTEVTEEELNSFFNQCKVNMLPGLSSTILYTAYTAATIGHVGGMASAAVASSVTGAMFAVPVGLSAGTVCLTYGVIESISDSLANGLPQGRLLETFKEDMREAISSSYTNANRLARIAGTAAGNIAGVAGYISGSAFCGAVAGYITYAGGMSHSALNAFITTGESVLNETM